MKRKPPHENTARVIALALGLTAALGIGGAASGVFAKLAPETLAALAVFAVGYAIATYLLDRQVRDFIDGGARRWLARKPVHNARLASRILRKPWRASSSSSSSSWPGSSRPS